MDSDAVRNDSGPEADLALLKELPLGEVFDLQKCFDATVANPTMLLPIHVAQQAAIKGAARVTPFDIDNDTDQRLACLQVMYYNLLLGYISHLDLLKSQQERNTNAESQSCPSP